MSVPHKECYVLVKVFDFDKNGQVGFDEFLKAFKN